MKIPLCRFIPAILALTILLAFFGMNRGAASTRHIEPGNVKIAGNLAGVTVAPTVLSVSTIATNTVTRYFTITNAGPYTLTYRIAELPPSGSIRATISSRQGSQPATDIQVEPELLNEFKARSWVDYLIYFHEQPDLAPAFGMGWTERGQFVVQALRGAAERSQARVRAYLDAQDVAYHPFWIDNVILVESSSKRAFDGLMNFAEIKALRAGRTMHVTESWEHEPTLSNPMAIESNISHVQADAVWDLGFTGEGIVVAGIDTGVRYTHQALVDHYRGNLGAGSFDHNYNWLDPDSGSVTPFDSHRHGSHTMGIMVGDDGGSNQIGMAPGARWIACDACGTSDCPDEAILTCAQWVVAPYPIGDPDSPNPDARPHVVNNSWGDCETSYDGWLQGAVDSWHAAGIYPVFSNGNASNCGYPQPPGCNTASNPARYGNVTGVGSTGRSNGQYAAHSNWGPTDSPDTINPRGYPNLKPQVLAPGVNIRSSVNQSDTAYDTSSGTSMAAPHVAGLIALMWQAAPCLVGDYAATETLIEQTATPLPYSSECGGEGSGNVPNHATGWGEIDGLAAVQAAREYCWNTDWLSWVSVAPITGVLATGEQGITVTFTCNYTESQKPQPLRGTLLVHHDDPCTGSVEIDLEFFCINMTPTWNQAVWINGDEQVHVEGPHVVRSGDTVVVVDRLSALFSETVTLALTETWGNALALASYDVNDVGNVTTTTRSLIWDVRAVASGVEYAITRTFHVTGAEWLYDVITQTLWIKDTVLQRSQRTLTFEHGCEPVTSADYDWSPHHPEMGDVVTFTAVHQPPYASTPVTYGWGFGDGDTAPGNPVTHTFPLKATRQSYTVTLNATNACSSQQEVAKIVVVMPHTFYLPLVMRDGQ